MSKNTRCSMLKNHLQCFSARHTGTNIQEMHNPLWLFCQFLVYNLLDFSVSNFSTWNFIAIKYINDYNQKNLTIVLWYVFFSEIKVKNEYVLDQQRIYCCRKWLIFMHSWFMKLFEILSVLVAFNVKS